LVAKLDKELADLSHDVGKLRNDINHFGFNNETSEYNKLESSINDYFNKFLSYIDADH